MDLRNPFVFSLSRFNPGQSSRRTALFQLLHDGAQPIGRFRMSNPHVMAEITRIVDESSVSHGKFRKASGVLPEVYHPYRCGQIIMQETS